MKLVIIVALDLSSRFHVS